MTAFHVSGLVTENEESFDYGYTISNGGTGGESLSQFMIPFFDTQGVAVIGNPFAPTGWTWSFGAAADSSWAYDPAHDPKSAEYAVAASSFQSPPYVLSFFVDRAAVSVERTLLNTMLSDLPRHQHRLSAQEATQASSADAVAQSEALVHDAEFALTEYEKFTPPADFDPQILAELQQRVLMEQALLAEAVARLADADAAVAAAQLAVDTAQAEVDAQQALVAALGPVENGESLAGFGFASAYGAASMPFVGLVDGRATIADPPGVASPGFVPEPGTLALVGLALAGLGLRRRRAA